MTTKPEMLTVAEAAAYLRVHPGTIRKMIERGEVSAIRAGRVWRVAAADIRPVRIKQAPSPVDTSLRRFARAEFRNLSNDADPDKRRGR